MSKKKAYHIAKKPTSRSNEPWAGLIYSRGKRVNANIFRDTQSLPEGKGFIDTVYGFERGIGIPDLYIHGGVIPPTTPLKTVLALAETAVCLIARKGRNRPHLHMFLELTNLQTMVAIINTIDGADCDIRVPNGTVVRRVVTVHTVLRRPTVYLWPKPPRD